jgi:hypothetical protein
MSESFPPPQDPYSAPSWPPAGGSTPGSVITGPAKAPRGWLWAALVFSVLGLAGCGVAAFGAWQGFSVVSAVLDDLDNPTPFGAEFEYTAESSHSVVLMTGEGVCKGADADGRPITFSQVSNEQTFEVNEADYIYFLVFDTNSGTEYTLTCGAEDALNSYVVISDPGIDSIPGVVVAAGVGAGSFVFLMLIAVICLIVGLVRRSGWKKRNQPQNWQGGAPAATYPYSPAPYGQPPYGQDPYGQAPYSQAPYGEPTQSWGPQGPRPPAQPAPPAPPGGSQPWVPPTQPPTQPSTPPGSTQPWVPPAQPTTPPAHPGAPTPPPPPLQPEPQQPDLSPPTTESPPPPESPSEPE